MKIGYVVLHYKTIDYTIKCVDSLIYHREKTGNNNIEIIIVDNGSPNDTGEILEAKYKDYSFIKVILSKKNVGFAKGNNLGFAYAKNTLKCQFIALLNNDTEIIDDGFTKKIVNIFEEEKYYVLGPDIYDTIRGHMNPEEQYILTLMGAIKTCRSIKARLADVKVHPEKYIREQGPIKFIPKVEEKKTNLKLNGACLIFSPLYVDKYDGLYDGTFLFREEDCLKLEMDYYGYKMLYHPDIQIAHKGMSTISREYADAIRAEIMSNEQHLNSVKAYIRLILKLKLHPKFVVKWVIRKIKKYFNK